MKRSAILALGILLIISLSNPVEAIDGLVSSIDDQRGVEVTVYNVNIGLVKDVRQVRLSQGVQELKFMDVASQIIPASVSIRSLSAPQGFAVLEQNYEYDLLSPRKLLDKYVGKKVKLLTRNPYTDKEEIVTVLLLSNNDGVPVFRIGDEITFNHPGRIIFPELPENLISKPTLVWLLNGGSGGGRNLEVLYLTNGLNWRADYVLLLDARDVNASLEGWVTIDNKSGTTYRDAKLKLVAGDINRVRAEVARREKGMMAADTLAAAAPQFKEEGLFEYHMYTLERKATIKENQTKQISLLDAENIPVRKEFVYRGVTSYYQNRYPERMMTEKVGVFVELQNRKEHNLGMPLPKGVVRVYKQDSDRSLQFIGEDAIDHTPKDEKIRIKLGNAFDIAAARKQMTWERIAKDTIETSFEVSLRNHKKEDILVKVVEPLYGDWKVLESSLSPKREDAQTVSFDVPVKKDGETKLVYKVRIKY
jgi:hypothetical protein